jgi:hypothetical protein
MTPRVLLSALTGRAYVTTRYRETKDGRVTAETKQDVTEDVVHHLMASAWARGWNDCNRAEPGSSPPNPYRPGGRP